MLKVKHFELVSNGKPVNSVLNLVEKQQTFVFEGITSAPIPSLFREFSAPIKLDFDYSDEQLSLLMTDASNEFARWDASQLLINKYIIANVALQQDNKDFYLPDAFTAAFKQLAVDKSIEPALKAEMLQFPSINSLMGLFSTVNIDALLAASKFIKLTIAETVASDCAAIYSVMPKQAYSVAHDQIALRSLKNTCLEYMALANSVDVNELVHNQFSSSDNMTDSMGAINAANKANLACFDNMMKAFEDKWSADGLVMDKWFAQVALSPNATCLNKVKETLEHGSFSLANPNRTRSLIGSFSALNPAAFHAIDGSGYEFLTDILCQLNSSNPQVASRLITPLIDFKKFDDARQTLMITQLQRLRELPDLAADLYEKIERALA